MPDRRKALWLVAGAVGLVAAALGTCQGVRGCDRRRGPEYAEETASWLAAVEEMGESGMWLVSRGYHLGDDLIAIATNSPLSHASILDLERKEVIEAVGRGVVAHGLADFLRESHRVQIIRPEGWTAERGAAAVARARGAIGRGYDFLGIVGVPSADHFYCSELALWSMGVEVDRAGPHRVLHPRHLDRHGQLLFDSRERDGVADH